MKGEIAADHMPLNKYTLQVVGLIPLTALEVGGLEDELETVELPDRTVASAGTRKATEFTMMIPMHHTAEQVVMELWFRESQDPVSPTYKKPATMTYESLSGSNTRNFAMSGVFPKKRVTPDAERVSEGEMAMVEWLMSVDDIIPI